MFYGGLLQHRVSKINFQGMPLCHPWGIFFKGQNPIWPLSIKIIFFVVLTAILFWAYKKIPQRCQSGTPWNNDLDTLKYLNQQKYVCPLKIYPFLFISQFINWTTSMLYSAHPVQDQGFGPQLCQTEILANISLFVCFALLFNNIGKCLGVYIPLNTDFNYIWI